MDLDDMKSVWAAYGAKLERSLAINERLLREVMMRKARFAVARYSVLRTLEVAFGVVALALTLRVLVKHAGEPRYLVLASAVVVFSAGFTWLCSYMLVASLRLDYSATVTAIRRDVERLKLVEFHVTKWAILGGTLLWLPILLVSCEIISGAPVLARIDLSWLIGNLAFGLGALAIGQAWSRKYVEHPGRGPLAQQVVDALSGKSLQIVTAHLAELASFMVDDAAA